MWNIFWDWRIWMSLSTMWTRVFISDGTWFDIFHDLPDVVGIPIDLQKGEYKDRWTCFLQNSAAFSSYRCFFTKSCLCGIIIVMASVHRCWCNRILYCPLYTKYWREKHLMTTLFYFGLGRRGTVHENVAVVILSVAKAGVIACRILIQRQLTVLDTSCFSLLSFQQL